MKGVLGRAAAAVVRNGRPRTRAGWWGAWRQPFAERGDGRFQGPDEPYPRHWRAGEPEPPAPLEVRRVRQTIDDLPATWRAVLLARDADRRSAADVAAELGLSAAQQRRILNHARAAVRAGRGPWS